MNSSIDFEPVSNEQHKAWALSIESGLFAAELLLNGNYKESDREDLEILIEIGQNNFKQFQFHNLRLARHLARQYSSKLNLEDKFQNAYFGLFRAIQGWDYKQGYSFSTYAVWWIRQSLSRSFMDQAFTIRIPVHMHEKLREIDKGIPVEPTDYKTIYDDPIFAAKMAIAESFSYEDIAFQLPELIEGEVSEWEDWVFDSTSQDFLKHQLLAVLETLSSREALVISMRFGLTNGSSCTLEEIGQHFGLTRERIRQIEEKVMKKLRHPSRSQTLREFLD